MFALLLLQQATVRSKSLQQVNCSATLADLVYLGSYRSLDSVLATASPARTCPGRPGGWAAGAVAVGRKRGSVGIGLRLSAGTTNERMQECIPKVGLLSYHQFERAVLSSCIPPPPSFDCPDSVDTRGCVGLRACVGRSRDDSRSVRTRHTWEARAGPPCAPPRS